MIRKLSLALTAMLLFSGPAMAGSVATTGHDLTDADAYQISGLTEICVVCHVPHGTVEGASVPLFNRAASAAGFTTGSSAINAGSTTEACLSCHDGVTNLDAYGGGADIGPNMGASAYSLGTNLTNDHPVGVPLTVVAGKYKNPTNVSLEVGNVECGVCHNPHDMTNGSYLEISNAGSALCGECHLY
jgi:predicted CXXCH cytochrome family protein